MGNGPPLLGFEIERNGAFVAKNRGCIERHVTDMLAHLAHRITVGWLDLDHVCTKIGQQTGAGRAGDGGADLDHLEACQRTHRLCRRSYFGFFH